METVKGYGIDITPVATVTEPSWKQRDGAVTHLVIQQYLCKHTVLRVTDTVEIWLTCQRAISLSTQ